MRVVISYILEIRKWIITAFMFPYNMYRQIPSSHASPFAIRTKKRGSHA